MTSSERPARLLFIDTETRTKQAKISSSGDIVWSGWDEYLYKEKLDVIELHRLELGWTCFNRYDKRRGLVGDVWRLWYSSKELCKYIESLTNDKTALYFFGHNIFFDLQASDFFYYFTLWGWFLEFCYDKALTYILVIRKGKRCIKCVSTTNYFPYNLDALGAFLKIPKLQIDFKQATRGEKIRYCKRDTLIIQKAIGYYISFLDKHELGKFSLTRASQAFTAYRTKFMKHKIYSHNDNEVIELEQAGYFGGRVECGFLGKLPKEDYLLMDVNSIYPYVMRKYKYPVRLVDYTENINYELLSFILKDYCVMAEVYLNTNEPIYAVRRHGKLIFPIGKFKTVICTEALKFAIKHKHLDTIIRMSIYSKADLFTNFVDYFYKYKQLYSKQDNKIMRNIAKYLMLHVYGKFAQMRPIVTEQQEINYKGYYREETYDIVTRQTEIVTKLFNKIYITFGREPSSYYFVPIPAHITENARLYLYQLMKTVGHNNFIYCDTDSLIIKKKHLPKLKKYLHEYRLGGLKEEYAFANLVINGAKYYTMGDIKKMKGVPAKANYLGDYKYEYTQFLRQDTHLRLQVTRFFVTKPVIKTVVPFYDKGKVLPDGRIERFTLSEF